MGKLQKILIAVDGSDHSMHALNCEYTSTVYVGKRVKVYLSYLAVGLKI